MGGDGEIRGKADMFVVWPWMWRFSRGGVLSVEVMARSRLSVDILVERIWWGVFSWNSCSGEGRMWGVKRI
jgi:hypothetical protein